jgi:WD40 repeat protein
MVGPLIPFLVILLLVAAVSPAGAIAEVTGVAEATPVTEATTPGEAGILHDPDFPADAPTPSVSATLVLIKGQEKKVTSTSFTSDGSNFMVGTQRGGAATLYKNSGEVSWQHREEVPIAGVACAPDGTAYAVAADQLYVFYPHGGVFWSFNPSGYFAHSVSISSEEGAYVAASFDDQNVYLFQKDGTIVWQYPIEDKIRSVSIAADGSYIGAGSDDDHVYLLDRSGWLVWEYETGGDVKAVSLSGDGSYIAVGSMDNYVYMFDRVGNLLWKYQTAGRVNGVSITPEGDYVAACAGSMIYLFNAGGDLAWSYDTLSRGSIVSISNTGSISGAEVTSVALSSMASYLVAGTGTGDQSVYLFSLDHPDAMPGYEDYPSGVPEDQRPFLYSAEGSSVDLNGIVSSISITREYLHDMDIAFVQMAVNRTWIDNRTEPGRVKLVYLTDNTTPHVLDTEFRDPGPEGDYIFEAVSTEDVASYGILIESEGTGAGDAGAFPYELLIVGLLAVTIGSGYVYTSRKKKSVRRYQKY